ncbi:MAG TPA: PDZ domain-containing protein [Thermoanaerobaculia bacterium]|nr:PDZ domain-containing protein [Thermoanaerobaculia bacterium]
MKTNAAVRNVRYRLSWGDPNEHLFDVEITFTAWRTKTDLLLPAWRPGRYLVQNYAANVRQWSATGDEGRALDLIKTDKTTWRVTSRKGESVCVRYRFFAGVLDAGSSFLDAGEAWFNGSNLFMMVVDQRKAPATLDLQIPKDWRVVTQLKRISAKRYSARDYDYLIDSPTIISPSVELRELEESGAVIVLAFQNQKGIDTRRFVAPVRKIVRGHAALFSGIPTSRYTFLYHVGDRWHGVEHEDSCSIILKRAELLGAGKDDPGTDHALAVTSHEFFHLWNVKRILPARFVPYDYARETPTKLLWVMEGVTSYYGEQMLRRTRLWSRERYLKHLSTEITTLETTPGKAWLSLSQASFDGWLQEPAQMHDKSNAWISFYNKGEIVAALMDIEIRRTTKGLKSLDELMRYLWKKYGTKGRGLEEDAIEQALQKLFGGALVDFHRRYVEGVEPLPYEELFGAAGLALTHKPGQIGDLGGKIRAIDGRLIVDSVRAGGFAMTAGLLPGDEILAIDGTRVTSQVALAALLIAGGRGKASVLFARNDVVRTVSSVSLTNGDGRFELSINEQRSPSQEEMLAGWLGED